MMHKIEIIKTVYKDQYTANKKDFKIIDIPPMNFLMLDGKGNPNTTPAYKSAVETLYAVSYALKMAIKKEEGIDYAVMPLEGLWWSENLSKFSLDTKEDWLWTMMIMQPEYVTQDWITRIIPEVTKKKNLPAIAKLRFESYHEGPSVQIMHTGPYEDEAPTIAEMHAFIAENNWKPSGKHHEIYFNDPNRTAPERLKTLLRQPFSVA
jgi:hypothetical protein